MGEGGRIWGGGWTGTSGNKLTPNMPFQVAATLELLTNLHTQRLKQSLHIKTQTEMNVKAVTTQKAFSGNPVFYGTSIGREEGNQSCREALNVLRPSVALSSVIDVRTSFGSCFSHVVGLCK